MQYPEQLSDGTGTVNILLLNFHIKGISFTESVKSSFLNASA